MWSIPMRTSLGCWGFSICPDIFGRFSWLVSSLVIWFTCMARIKLMIHPSGVLIPYSRSVNSFFLLSLHLLSISAQVILCKPLPWHIGWWSVKLGHLYPTIQGMVFFTFLTFCIISCTLILQIFRPVSSAVQTLGLTPSVRLPGRVLLAIPVIMSSSFPHPDSSPPSGEEEAPSPWGEGGGCTGASRGHFFSFLCPSHFISCGSLFIVTSSAHLPVPNLSCFLNPLQRLIP
jgi:hypothetical protein